MKYGKLLPVLLLCVMLCGCDYLSRGSYVSIEDPKPQSSSGVKENPSADSYQALYMALAEMIENGVTQRTLSVGRYDKSTLEADLARIQQDICQTHPIAAWAVQQIRCTRGTIGGTDAVSVEISYLHGKNEIHRIVTVNNNEQARDIIASALNNFDTGIVLQVLSYTEVDYEQMVADYALKFPEFVMELPQLSVTLFPENGESRVVELKFSYQTSRDILKKMQNQVAPVFTSAVLYVSGDAVHHQKYAQLFSFLMERYDYKLDTSITPTYSLLRQGIGDSRSFAMVYAAMCRQAGLTCQVVSGTRDGQSWYWNIVLDDGYYYHVDLLRCSENGSFEELGDSEMDGYVWATGYYPSCGIPEPEPPYPIEPKPPFEPSVPVLPPNKGQDPEPGEENIEN